MNLLAKILISALFVNISLLAAVAIFGLLCLGDRYAADDERAWKGLRRG